MCDGLRKYDNGDDRSPDCNDGSDEDLIFCCSGDMLTNIPKIYAHVKILIWIKNARMMVNG